MKKGSTELCKSKPSNQSQPARIGREDTIDIPMPLSFSSDNTGSGERHLSSVWK